MKAVVAHAVNEFSVANVTLDKPKTGEVLVKMKATGICHSDLSIINGTIRWKLPSVLGHEGAGIVEEVGEGVTNVKPGDHVVLSFVPNCGNCYFCDHHEPHLCAQNKPHGGLIDGTSRVKLDGKEITVMSFLGNMAEYCVVPSVCVVSIDKSHDFKAAALVGCGVTTGVGAAIKTAEVKPGSTVAVFGCGGVGLNVIQGARIAGAAKIIAVDLSAERMELARSFGATDVIDPKTDAFKQVLDMTNGIGVDYAFEVVGMGKLVEACFKATRMGGMTVLVGVGRADDRFSFNAMIVPFTAKTIRGCMYGSANFKVDFPMYLDLYRQKKLDLDRLVTRTYTIDEAPEAFADLEKGVNARGVIVY
ncbi:MAG: Zn-dependent alcohol dehydrogenase [Proteobacteria bacterium]|jgi:S-(hydroxymethyl)glutathione dehydrogenase/alcohol dehydrogenase|nr:Zn-dependent alcohol dehydrogenase [Pseudomonadota bacterium]